MWEGWSHRVQFWEGEPRAWEISGGQNGIETVWLLGCCDASDVTDGEDCIISIMRGSGGNVSRLLLGLGVDVDDRKGGTKGR